MNKTILSTALLTFLSATAYADADPVPAAPMNSTEANSPAPTSTAPATEAIKPAGLSTPQPIPAVIDCKYHIPAETTNVEQTVLSTWAGKAAVQSFNFNPTTVDEELGALKLCYTDQGWQGFNDALQKSGNVNAIKLQHLSVSSQVDGDVKINPIKDNQWKVTVPLQVVYQNEKEKLTQLLTIDLLVGRKISGDLGIMQMIATPRQVGAAQSPTTPTENHEPVAGGPTQDAPAGQATQATPAPAAQKPMVDSKQTPPPTSP